jgi:hypothetical protein
MSSERTANCEVSLLRSTVERARLARPGQARRERERRARERAGPEAANDDETAGNAGTLGRGGARKLSEAARQKSQPVRMEARQGSSIGSSLADP